MREPKPAYCNAYLHCSQQDIPFVLATKIYPRGLVYKWDGDNNSRSSPERAEFIYYQDRKILLEIILRSTIKGTTLP